MAFAFGSVAMECIHSLHGMVKCRGRCRCWPELAKRRETKLPVPAFRHHVELGGLAQIFDHAVEHDRMVVDQDNAGYAGCCHCIPDAPAGNAISIATPSEEFEMMKRPSS